MSHTAVKYVHFIIGDRHLGFLLDVDVTGSGTIDPKKWGTAVVILLLLALDVEIYQRLIYLSPSCRQTSQKTGYGVK